MEMLIEKKFLKIIRVHQQLQGQSIFQNNLAQRIVLEKVWTYFPFTIVVFQCVINEENF